MPLDREIYAFPALNRETFRGLPGLLADSLPDRFGNEVINAWLAAQGRTPKSFNPVERLCYTGTRGMGALEYEPAEQLGSSPGQPLNIQALVELASEILSGEADLKVSLADEHKAAALNDILRVGTSAGGARAKAVIAWNPETNEVRSGQIDTGDGFFYWILKFDGVSGNRDKELADSKGFGLIEYAYYKMATEAGIAMSECRILEENGRNHFMTKRFDRTDEGRKLHMQSLSAIAHYDFNLAGAYSYEQAFQVMRRLKLPVQSINQQFRRMVFNIMARNQDDHVKNIAFIMDRTGRWRLSPAFDVIYAFNPDGPWTGQHQMSMNGKRRNFRLEDFIACARSSSLKRGIAKEILGEVRAAVSDWSRFAAEAGVPDERAKEIGKTHQLSFA